MIFDAAAYISSLTLNIFPPIDIIAFSSIASLMTLDMLMLRKRLFRFRETDEAEQYIVFFIGKWAPQAYYTLVAGITALIYLAFLLYSIVFNASLYGR